MPRLRYVRTPEQVRRAREADPELLESSVRSLRCVYETHPAIARALLIRPLEPAPRPEVCVTFSHVEIHVSPEFTLEIGSALFGVRARYEGVEGIWLLTMPMTAEAAVVGGRETYGEPKKIAEIDFAGRSDGGDDRLSARVARLGMTYLSATGTLGRALGPREWTEHGFCLKAFPGCEKGRAFDADPLLVQLTWRHRHTGAWEVDGAELILGESPVDPVADAPVVRLVRCEYEEGTSRSDGRVLRALPAEWALPFLHGRYDDASGEGLEVAL